jgi:DNA-binding NtrC family response regulator
MARILCLDDDDAVRAMLVRLVEREGHDAVGACHAPAAFQILEGGDIDLVLADYQLPGMSGLEFLETLARQRACPPVIMVTAHGTIDHAIAAVRAGAADYLLKPFDTVELLHRIAACLENARVRRELDALRQEVAEQRAERGAEHRMLGKSAVLARVRDIIAAAAASRSTVLIDGESGTGKELVARAVHAQSDRCDKPFIRLNCAALPEGLVESALFGHEKGAFTGAIRRVEGAFERADGGTLLLDEISEMRVDLQAKLLRILQEREFERVGGTSSIKVDVRIIATTNRSLTEEIERNAFRRDLYYRLNVVPVTVPPLRDRVEDIPVLAYHFASRVAAECGKRIEAISADAFELLQRHPWPGNVRELQHVIERAVVLAEGPVLHAGAFDTLRDDRVESIAGWIGARPAARAAANSPTVLSAAIMVPSLNLADAEKALIERALRDAANNRTQAAALLGIAVRTLRKKLNASTEGLESLPASAPVRGPARLSRA